MPNQSSESFEHPVLCYRVFTWQVPCRQVPNQNVHNAVCGLMTILSYHEPAGKRLEPANLTKSLHSNTPKDGLRNGCAPVFVHLNPYSAGFYAADTDISSCWQLGYGTAIAYPPETYPPGTPRELDDRAAPPCHTPGMDFRKESPHGS